MESDTEIVYDNVLLVASVLTSTTATLINLSANQMSLVYPTDQSDCLKIGIR